MAEVYYIDDNGVRHVTSASRHISSEAEAIKQHMEEGVEMVKACFEAEAMLAPRSRPAYLRQPSTLTRRGLIKRLDYRITTGRYGAAEFVYVPASGGPARFEPHA